MNSANIGMKDLIKELGIIKNKVEFTNDLNLFLNISAFDESQGEYYDIIKSKFDENMGKWNININDNFSIISKYIKSRKLPYKIVKDEGFEMIKSEKFVVSMLVELYAMYIVINNNEVSKNEMIKFIHNEFKLNGLNVYEKDIVLNDLEYLFRDKKLTLMCKTNLNNKKIEIKRSLDKTINAIEKRKNIKLKLSEIMQNKPEFKETTNDIKNDLELKNIELKNIELKKSLEKLREEVEINKHIINEYIDKEIVLQNEITKLQKYNLELISYGKEQYSKALVDLVRNMNDDTNGNILDRLYCYSKGEQEKNLMFVATNLFNVFRQMGISPRETKKIGTNVDIEEYSFYNYRLNKDISDIKLSKGDVLYPAWFYNGVEILKPYVNIKGE